MPTRYARLANDPSTQDELEASFDADDSDIEDQDIHTQAESRPLNRSRSQSTPPTASGPAPYDFENLDYDYPPPGSPPQSSTLALPNSIGNTNGLLPQAPHAPSRSQRSGWFQRATGAILPKLSARRSINVSRPIGGGNENDGVFANISAKPARGRVVVDGDNGIYVVPEEVLKEPPPSYATAQADAVPPYWETTIHAPVGFEITGNMMVEGLPTGSFLSFVWNFLISMSFQFIGFLLTFVLHSTHAGKLGSRAGLGVTLIHYGFYFRARLRPYGNNDGFFSSDGEGEAAAWWPSQTAAYTPKPTFGTAAEAEGYYSNLAGNGTLTLPPTYDVRVKPTLNEGATEWISFALMTIGWFILLTSTLSFWRVKRWERSMLASTPPEATIDEGPSHAHNPFYALSRFGFPGAMFRGFRHNSALQEEPPHDEEAMLSSNGTHVYPLSGNDEQENIERAGRYAHSRAREARLENSLIRAGLL